ncbi:MAG TPA: acyl-CoA dehydrogenase family protein [Candidatus Limnocylindrales bacterium]|nr:acyl-CoA dehydrogenase family protein [Candidatus Limnocylindrales bacterium]
MLSFDLTTEQEQLKQTAREFAEQEIIPVAGKYDEAEEFPHDVMRKAWEVGLLNLEVPPEHGGIGLGVLDSILVLEEINYGCAGMATIMAANDLASTPLLIAGSEQQKDRYLGALTRQCAFAAYALSEPGSGSDAASLSTTYRKVGSEFVINGVKHFITNGTVAEWYVVFATRDKAMRHGGISCFVLPADTPGITAHKMKGKLGQRASDTAEIVLEEVCVPESALVGEEGQGFKIAMQTFDRTRPQIGAICIGVTQRALDECTRYALERQQFGRSIAEFQAVQFMLADMAIDLEAMRLLTYKAGWLIDSGERSSIVSSFSKAFGADHAMQHCVNAVQIFGGFGYFKEYPVEKLMRDIKLVQIYEGTSQIQRVVIARNLLKS